MNYYYIFGLQRSGTNYIEQLFKENFLQIELSNVRGHAWKHSIDVPPDMIPDRLAVIVYKNPLTWVESIAFRTPIDFFKEQKTYSPSVDNMEGIAKTYRHWYETWVVNYTGKSIVVKYEDLLIKEKREQFLETVGVMLNLQKKWDTWKNIEAGKVSISEKYTEERTEYYIKGVPTLLTKEQIDAIERIL